MNNLAQLIKTEIEAQGAISLARYMDLALQHPLYGYYKRKDPLGRAGDFITSPEISQMFGELIGLWLAEAWVKMGSPQQVALLEMGPGRGTLMQDALRATAKIKGFHEAVRLFLYESNATLRAAQGEKLGLYNPVFLDDLQELPPLPLLFVANEFFDAMPIHQFVKHDHGWCERMVCCLNEHFSFCDNAHSGLSFLGAGAFSDLSFYETSPSSVLLARELAEKVATFGGVGLVIDYGYVTPPNAPTLQAVSQHTQADVLQDPGDVDLTAHVDFARLSDVFKQVGTRVVGPVGQGEFLDTLGISVREAQLCHKATPEQDAEIRASVRRLIDPTEMGVLFKVMAVAHQDVQDLEGFR